MSLCSMRICAHNNNSMNMCVIERIRMSEMSEVSEVIEVSEVSEVSERLSTVRISGSGS